MRSFLAWADAGAFVLDEAGHGTEAAVGLDGIGGDASAGVVGDEDELAAGCDGDVAGVGAFGGQLIEQCQFVGLGITFEGGDSAGLFSTEVGHLVDGVDDGFGWM